MKKLLYIAPFAFIIYLHASDSSISPKEMEFLNKSLNVSIKGGNLPTWFRSKSDPELIVLRDIIDKAFSDSDLLQKLAHHYNQSTTNFVLRLSQINQTTQALLSLNGNRKMTQKAKIATQKYHLQQARQGQKKASSQTMVSSEAASSSSSSSKEAASSSSSQQNQDQTMHLMMEAIKENQRQIQQIQNYLKLPRSGKNTLNRPEYETEESE